MSFSTLDELATWMLTNIRLSRYDNQFINNLTLYITNHQRITTNQDSLFKKVTKKYNRQLLHYKINADDVLNLKWSVNVVESIPEFTGASIKIENDKIIFRSPYNKNFLTALRKNFPYKLEWIKAERQYEANYSPTVLKQLMYLSADHYSVLNYCDKVTQIINSLSEYESVKYWVPTLVYNRGYYVAAINEQIYNLIKDIEITDDLRTIAQLAKYGIVIDQSVNDRFVDKEAPEKIKIATSFHMTVELRDMKNVLEWLHELGCDAVNEAKSILSTGSITLPANEFITVCKRTTQLSDFENPVFLHMRGNIFLTEPKPLKLFKIIRVVNSDPVNLGPK